MLTINSTKDYFKSFFANQLTALTVLGFLAFIVPIVFAHASFQNQLIIGIAVNFLLASSALNLGLKRTLPIILLPSLGALASGIVFGPFTIFLVYLVPFIWVGNAVYAWIISSFAQKTGYLALISGASLAKALAIFVPTLGLFYFGLVPEVLLIPMGILQFATALVGGTLAGITK